MNEQHAELSSALLDGEIDDGSHDRIVGQLLKAPPGSLEQFARYRLIGDAIRGETPMLAEGVAQRVSAALADEPVVLAPRGRAARWVRPLTGVALAASVATAALVIAPGMLDPADDRVAPQMVVSPAAVAGLSPSLVSAPTGREPATATTEAPERKWQAVDEALRDRLNRLVIEHHEFSGRTGINGPVSHIGLVSYEGR